MLGLGVGQWKEKQARAGVGRRKTGQVTPGSELITEDDKESFIGQILGFCIGFQYFAAFKRRQWG